MESAVGLNMGVEESGMTPGILQGQLGGCGCCGLQWGWLGEKKRSRRWEVQACSLGCAQCETALRYPNRDMRKAGQL